MWTTFILIFAGVWTVQIIMAQLQARHFRQTFNEMRQTTDSGYLGVGVHKPRFGVGSVVILVTDKEHRILKAAHMTGVTVFTRFKPLAELIGKPLKTIPDKADKSLVKATLMAASRIEEQINGEGQVRDGEQGNAAVDAGEQAV